MKARGRAIYCNDTLWKKAKKYATKQGFVSMSELIRHLLIKAMEE